MLTDFSGHSDDYTSLDPTGDLAENRNAEIRRIFAERRIEAESRSDAKRQEVSDHEYVRQFIEGEIKKGTIAGPAERPMVEWEGSVPSVDVLTIDGLRSHVNDCFVSFVVLKGTSLRYPAEAFDFDCQTVRDAYRAGIYLGVVDVIPTSNELSDANAIENAWHKLRTALESFDCENVLGTQHQSGGPIAKVDTTKQKRSTEPGEAKAKIIAALTAHHKYEKGSCLHGEPIGVRVLASQADVSIGSVSEFFAEQFGSHANYKAACREAAMLGNSLRMLNGELTPSILFKRLPDDAAE